MPFALRRNVEYMDGQGNKKNLADELAKIGTGTGGSGSVSSTTTYEIELARWGIQQGLPTKPYTVANYNKADANITGINNALQWAFQNNYNVVKFPRGEYSICYPKSIETQANMTLDFNFSTLKVMYDSDVRSPYDTSSNPTYLFAGNSIVMRKPNSHIINLTLIGDRIERSWANAEEKSVEWTSGIVVSAGADRCSVRNCNISYYMADAIVTGYGPYGSFTIGQMEFGGISDAGALVTGATSKTVRSIDYVALPNDIQSFTMIGLGYAPATSIPSTSYNVYFYNNSNALIAVKKNVRTRDRVSIPKGATKIKLTWEGDGTVNGGTTWPDNPPYWVLLVKHGLSEFLWIDNNEIHRNHRGGVLVGTNNVLVSRNYFHDNAVATNTDLDGLPSFTDFTRYSITTEDNVGHNCRFINNVFENTRMAIALRGEYNEISGNEFRNCAYGTILYYQKHIIIHNNYYYYSPIGNFEYENFHRNWTITNNVFTGGNAGLSFTGSGTISTVNNNQFLNTNSAVSTTVRILNFRNNSFDNASFFWANSAGAKTIMDSCSFINGSQVYYPSLGMKVIDNLRRCVFMSGAKIRIQGSGNIHTIVRDCEFEDGYFEYSTVDAAKYTFDNCRINNTTQPLIYSPVGGDMGVSVSILELRNSNVSIKDKQLIDAFGWGGLIIENSDVTFDFATPPTNVFKTGYGSITDTLVVKNSRLTGKTSPITQSVGSITDIKVIDNQLTNFSFTNPNNRTIVYLEDSYFTEPTTGYFFKGKLLRNNNVVAGGFLGWICITEGYANNTAWVASTSYTVGNLIYANANVYKCTIAGTSGTTAPTHTTGTAGNGTATFEYMGVKAVFKEYGLISE